MLNRREAIGGIGLAFAFLFRGRSGALQAEPETVEQAPAACAIVVEPMIPFRPQRIVITPENARGFVIEDITIGQASQFAASEAIPAEVFGMDSPELQLDIAHPSQAIRFRVRYVGKIRGGKRFIAALFGRDERGRMLVLPIDSVTKIVA